jgi:hypothetical protein
MMKSYKTNLDGLSFDQIGSLFSLMKDNLLYANDFNLALVSKIQEYRETIHALNDSQRPLVGHRVKVITKEGKVYENSLIESVNDDETITLCMNASAHICSTNLRVTGLPLCVSGGYFSRVPVQQLTPLDQTLGRYWLWGDRPCEKGGIYINEQIKRWLLDDSKGAIGLY